MASINYNPILTAHGSTLIAVQLPTPAVNTTIKRPNQFLIMPAAPADPGLPLLAPSVFNLTRPSLDGC
uniref:Uncharacterized protein n=1 Tax=Populus trichocarpa TaxID=3694 RepID=A0A2K1YS18_POPTR